MLVLILAVKLPTFNLFLMFSNYFSAILNEFLIYCHICFNYVSFVQIKKKPLAGLLSHRHIRYSVLEEIAMEIPAVVDRPAARAKVHLRQQRPEQV